ncbi:MAG: 5-(carboxyamino)imidazole ribonucleotide synthase [Armatimonadota bacterium]
MIPPGSTIGILGDGQLGRMLAIAARQMGYEVQVLGPNGPDSPAGQIASRQVVADYTDQEAVKAFARAVDVVTYEFENVSAESIKTILSEGKPARPGANVLYTTQNRLREKRFLQSIGCATAPFAAVTSENDIAVAVEVTGLPGVLKTAGSGYDGKGQRVVRTIEETAAAWEELGRVDCVLEGFVDFAWEGSIVAARGVDGSYADFGLVKNDHSHHILDVTEVPAPSVTPELSQKASMIARSILQELDVVGVLCVELFVTAEGTLRVNELAPRPHNSGHFTIDACVTSQFEQQLRAVCGLPLGDPSLLGRGAAMANLLGDVWTDHTPDWSGMMTDFPDVKLHLYGKAEAKPGRKMGHLTVSGKTGAEAAERVRQARARLR